MNRVMYIVLVLVIAGGFFAAGKFNRDLVESRRVYGITQADPLVNAPPLVVFTTVAFGGFRGIVADILWLRSARLQQEGKYFELVQLADWITKLEPRFTEVWAYHAWNLAYNISVLFNDPENRWRWVRHGVGLLRDEGLKYNPGEPGLLFELGWFYQHKIGGDTDDFHHHYKQAWAAEMSTLFPDGRADYEAIASDRDRQTKLVEEYKLDPAVMQRLEATCGALDWRLPFAHALYWAYQSREAARGMDAVFADRMIYQSIGDAFRKGRLFEGHDGRAWVLSPDFARLPFVISVYEEMIVRTPDPSIITEAYAFFLREAVFYSFLYGRDAEAHKMLERLKKLVPEIPALLTAEEFVVDLFGQSDAVISREQTIAMVESALYRALRHRRDGDEARANELERQAEQTWTNFMRPRENRPDFLTRTGLPPLADIRASAEARLTE